MNVNLIDLWLQTLLWASVAVIAVFGLRWVLHRLGGAVWRYRAWGLLPLASLGLLVSVPKPEALSAQATPLSWLASLPVATPTPAPQSLWPSLLAAVWVIGAVLFLGSLAAAQWRLARRCAGSAAAVDGELVWISQRADTGPLAIGLLSPRRVLPADWATRFTPSERTYVLAHEALHIRRGDLWVNALVAMTQALLWFHPLVHWAAAALRRDQELSCDTNVARAHPECLADYARAITKASQGTAFRTPPMAACLATPSNRVSTHPLKERIMSLTSPQKTPVQRRLAAFCAGTAALLSIWAVGLSHANEPPLKAGMYRVAFDYNGKSPGAQTKTKFTMHVEADKPGSWHQNGGGCTGEFTVSPTAKAGEVQIGLLVNGCSDKPLTPKLITRLGTPAVIEFGDQSQAVHRFEILVTQ
jgi:bla regulator protein blaR1